MNVLITGASGFFGSHIAEAFQRQGHQVIVLARPTSRVGFLKTLNVEIRTAALDQPDSLQRAMKNVHLVIHAAAKVDSFGTWREFQRDIVAGTRHALEAATQAGVASFIHISSRGIYERPVEADPIYSETSPYGTPYRWSYYARAKIAAETIVRAAPIPTTILRPTWIYGPRDTTILPRIIGALRTRRYRWIGDATNRLNLIYVTDAANAVLAATKTPGEIYNVCDDENSVTQHEFITRICELLALPLPVRSISYRQAHTTGLLCECAARVGVRFPMTRLSALLLGGRRRFSNEKLRRELGWTPTVSFEQGIRLALHAAHEP
jgi:nucleoside-diphosphate-sugar epimerase